MAISVSGSGIDIATTVSQLVAATRAPTQARITSNTTTVNAKLSAVGQIKSGLTNLQSALSKLSTGADTPSYTATVASGAGFTASTGSGAVAGDYSVEVVRTATAQKLSSQGYASGTAVGNGTLSIAYGDETVGVTINEGATLSDIATAINKAAGGKGVVASVVTANDGQHLVLSAANTGSAGALTITASGGDGGLDALTTSGGLSEAVAASDALVRVDGFERTSASNSITDLVPGVTLTLNKADEGTRYNLNIASDTTDLKSAVTSFVTAYNSIISTLKSTSAYNSTTQTASALTGDSLVRGLQQQIRGQVSANTLDLKALGVTLDKDGVMSFDSSAFDSTLATDPEAVTRQFGADGALTSALNKVITGQLDTYTGSLTLRTNNLNDQIKDLQKQTDTLDDRMTKLSALYTKQFTAMETMVQQLQSNGSSLNDLLSSS
jgi:flagellar hook-associated protein 2